MNAKNATRIITVCKPGQVYNLNELTLMGWTPGDGTGTEGYNLADYFDADGRYLGPDVCGIEPMVTIEGYVRLPYKIAFVLESTGEFEIVNEFEALDDADANRYAETNYDGEPWYVLDASGRNINGGDQE